MSNFLSPLLLITVPRAPHNPAIYPSFRFYYSFASTARLLRPSNVLPPSDCRLKAVSIYVDAAAKYAIVAISLHASPFTVRSRPRSHSFTAFR